MSNIDSCDAKDSTQLHPTIREMLLRRRKPHPEQRTAEEYPWMQPMKDLRETEAYRDRRNSIVLAMQQRQSRHAGRPLSTDEWRQFVSDLIGPAPPMDHDAAGNPHNPDWWLHYSLTVDAQQIRQQGMRVLRGAPLVDP